MTDLTFSFINSTTNMFKKKEEKKNGSVKANERYPNNPLIKINKKIQQILILPHKNKTSTPESAKTM
jgi:hypothetical protein